MPTAQPIQSIPAINTCTVSEAHRLLLADIERQRTDALRTARKAAVSAPRESLAAQPGPARMPVTIEDSLRGHFLRSIRRRVEAKKLADGMVRIPVDDAKLLLEIVELLDSDLRMAKGETDRLRGLLVTASIIAQPMSVEAQQVPAMIVADGAPFRLLDPNNMHGACDGFGGEDPIPRPIGNLGTWHDPDADEPPDHR